jgi:hypothetical protein
MKTAKDEVRELLDNLPDDASLADIQYHTSSCARRSSGVSQPLNKVEQSRMTRWFVAWPDGSRSSMDRLGVGGP